MIRARLGALLATLAVLALTGCGGGQPASVPPLVVDRAPMSSAPAVVPAAPDVAPADPAPAAAEFRVSVPGIEASSSLIPLGLNADRTIEVPPESTPEQAGLYTRGPEPGEKGPAIILGHVNGGGRQGVFADLSQVAEGDQVEVARPDGSTAVFAVYRTATVEKERFPTAAVYSDTAGPELRLITCGGALNYSERSYLSNVIVFASLTRIV